jgi:hypothetical protein
MKILLHFMTAIGPRTIVVEIGDRATAQAVVNAHLGLGELASMVEEMPRLSLKDHMAKHKRAKGRAEKLKVITTPSNVTPLRKGKRG